MEFFPSFDFGKDSKRNSLSYSQEGQCGLGTMATTKTGHVLEVREKDKVIGQKKKKLQKKKLTCLLRS